MTWSRLEGLRFHWAVASSPKGHWELPPRGWKTLPDTTGAREWGNGWGPSGGGLDGVQLRLPPYRVCPPASNRPDLPPRSRRRRRVVEHV
jgi:hypothetical protein